MPGHNHGPSIKNPRVYEVLRRRRGMSKAQAAAISNAMVKKDSAVTGLAIPPTGPNALFNQPGVGGIRARRRQKRYKAANWGARVGQVISGALTRGEGGRFSRGGGEAAPAKPPSASRERRTALRAARQQRMDDLHSARAQEQADEVAKRAEENAYIAGGKTGRERQRRRAEIALKRRERALARREAHQKQIADEHAKRSEEDAAPADEGTPEAQPKKGGGGGGGGGKKKPSDEEKRAAQDEKKAKWRTSTAPTVGLSTDEADWLAGVASGTALAGSFDGRHLAELGLTQDTGDTTEATDAGRRLLNALERGDTRGALAAIQDGKARLTRDRARAEQRWQRDVAKQTRIAQRRQRRLPKGPPRQTTKAQSDEEKAMFANMGGGKGSGGGGGGKSTLWPKGPDGKRVKPSGESSSDKPKETSGGLPGIPEGEKPGYRIGGNPAGDKARREALSAREKKRKSDLDQQGKPPEITNGTPKQNSYANDIRGRMLRDAERVRQQFLEEGVRRGYQALDSDLRKMDAAINKLREHTDHRWWIDNRDSNIKRLLSERVEKSYKAQSTFGGQKRPDLADSVFAGPDRSFPIKTAQDVRDAVRSLGRTKHDKAAVKRGIIRRARTIGAVDALPESWRAEKEQGALLRRPSQPVRTVPGGANRGEISIPLFFTVFKDAAGRDRWAAITTTAYQDKDGEWIGTKAIRGVVEAGDRGAPRGPLRFWHVPGLDLGDCDYQASAFGDRFLIESGTFRSPAAARIGQKAAARGYQMSPGFLHSHREPLGGLYEYIALFERSFVPPGRAANPGTSFITKGDRMLTDEKKKEFEALAGDAEGRALLEGLLAQAATTVKANDEAGAIYKDAPAWAQALVGRMEALEERLKALPPAAAVDEEAAAADDLAALDEPDGDEGMDDEAFADLIVEKLAAKFGPMLDLEKKVAGYLDNMKGMLAPVQQKDDARMQEIASLDARLKELEGGQPRARTSLAAGVWGQLSGVQVTKEQAKALSAQTPAGGEMPPNLTPQEQGAWSLIWGDNGTMPQG